MAGEIPRSELTSARSRNTSGSRAALCIARSAQARRGFSLIELLVVMGVASLLISLLMPAFAQVREAARRVACASNMHQMAIALESYSRDNRNRLPNSYFAGNQYREPRPQDMMILNRGAPRDAWDGMGRLFSRNYINAAGVFYCPSHTGNHTIDRYEDFWKRESQTLIFGNYQYRGMLNLNSQQADPIDRYDRDRLRMEHPSGVSLLADGLRTKSDFSHVIGCNLLEDDLSVTWYIDKSARVYSILPDTESENWPRAQVWFRLDQGLGNQ